MNNQRTKDGARVILAGQAHMEYAVDIPPGIKYADLLKPEYWRLNADGRLRPHDRVRVRSDSEGFDCRLTVVGVMPNAGLLMRNYDLENAPGQPMGDYLREIEAQVRAEEETKARAEIEAAIGGRP